MRNRKQSAQSLQEEHAPHAIRERLSGRQSYSYLSDAILGGIDGCVTTFAVVAGVVGGGLANIVVIILGFANLVADGFSMAVSNYQSTKSQRQLVDRAREEEERHIALIPEGEREEVRQIYMRKGFRGETLDSIVKRITSDRRLWVDTMLTEELGLQLSGPKPIQAGFTTFAAFLLIGLLPLLPFLSSAIPPAFAFLWSTAAAAGAFFLIGLAKGLVLQRSPVRAGLETLFTGGGAAALAYLVGAMLRQLVDTGI